MNKNKSIFVTLCLIVSLFIPSAFAMKLTIMTEDLPPYGYLDKNNKVIGIATERVNKMLTCAKIDADFFVVPWSRAFQYVKSHKNSIIYSMVRNKTREKDFFWLGKVAVTNDHIYKLKSRTDIKFSNIDEMKKYTIGVMEDDFIVTVLKKQGFTVNKNLFYYLDSKIKVKLLLNNRYDLIDENPEVVLFKIKQKAPGYDQLKKLIPLIKPTPLYAAMNVNSDEDLKKRLKSCMQQTSNIL